MISRPPLGPPLLSCLFTFSLLILFCHSPPSPPPAPFPFPSFQSSKPSSPSPLPPSLFLLPALLFLSFFTSFPPRFIRFLSSPLVASFVLLHLLSFLPLILFHSASSSFLLSSFPHFLCIFHLFPTHPLLSSSTPSFSPLFISVLSCLFSYSL